jgi:hypothetical protein
LDRARKLLGEYPETEEIVEALGDPVAEVESGSDLFKFSMLKAGDVAALLGISPPDLLSLVQNGNVLAVSKGDATVFPKWQFDEDHSIRPGIDQLIATFRDVTGNDVNIAAWASTPQAELGSIAPAELIVDGRIDDVILAAKTTSYKDLRLTIPQGLSLGPGRRAGP